MKVCVYAIARDEAKNVSGWMESMGEADGVTVLDTGSGDGTPALLRSLGAVVREERIEPWRFDAARNRALELVPEDADICVSTDLDERFRPGWRAVLERAWTEGTKQAECRYTWNFRPDGSEGVVFYRQQIHSRKGWRWKNAVHEVLSYEGSEPYRLVRAAGVQLDHHPDGTKSRAQYLPLLEQSVAEEPENDRNVHYLGREYMYYGRWSEAIAVLRRHLAMPSATWREERCASYRYIARCEEKLGQGREAFSDLLRAAAEAPWLREPWVETAQWYYRRENWRGVVWAAENALALTERGESYVCEAEAWGALPWDLASIGYWKLGERERALRCAEEALRLSPGEERIARNCELMRRFLAAEGV